jgi:hypothetical protein
MSGPYVAVESFGGWCVTKRDEERELLTIDPEHEDGERVAKRIAFLLNRCTTWKTGTSDDDSTP